MVHYLPSKTQKINYVLHIKNNKPHTSTHIHSCTSTHPPISTPIKSKPAHTPTNPCTSTHTTTNQPTTSTLIHIHTHHTHTNHHTLPSIPHKTHNPQNIHTHIIRNHATAMCVCNFTIVEYYFYCILYLKESRRV